ncbi:3-hydroxyacyl-CoA dehydrogenase family protein [Bacteroidota bacterium]
MEVRKVGIVGLGVQGQGIAEVSARAGYNVVVTTRSRESLNKGLELIRSSIAAGVKRNKLTQDDMDMAMERIKGTLSIEDFEDCDILVEVVREIMEEKKEVLKKYDQVCKPETIINTGTSTLSIVDLANATKRPDKVIGTHYFWPVPKMKLVEIVFSIVTSQETFNNTWAFCESIGKSPVRAPDSPGFIANRMFVAYSLEAFRMLEQGVATREDIDRAAELGLNHPMGPLRLHDFAGIESTYYAAVAMYEETKDPKFAPPILLKKMVAANHLGRKTGKGFYDYPKK